MNPFQRGARAFAASLFLVGAAAADVVVRIEEVPTPSFDTMFNVSNIASDGTLVGATSFPRSVVRWRPGQPAENLGGGQIYWLGNVTPLISQDASTIAMTVEAVDADGNSVEAVARWAGGTTWRPIDGTVLDSSAVHGMSDDGRRLAGIGWQRGDGHGEPWIWSAATGQVVLPKLPGRLRTEAWGVSNDGRVAIGYADDHQTDLTRYGTMWIVGAVTALVDDERQPLSQATACNSDCSVIVGSGFGFGGPGSPFAWRKTAQGVEYLGEVAGALPGMPYYAMDTSEDGSTIVGIYAELVVDDGGAYAINRPFIWTRQEGIVDFVAWLAARGVDYGSDFRELGIVAMARDGSRLVLTGVDADNRPRHAVVRIQPETIFAGRFE